MIIINEVCSHSSSVAATFNDLCVFLFVRDQIKSLNMIKEAKLKHIKHQSKYVGLFFHLTFLSRFICLIRKAGHIDLAQFLWLKWLDLLKQIWHKFKNSTGSSDAQEKTIKI